MTGTILPRHTPYPIFAIIWLVMSCMEFRCANEEPASPSNPGIDTTQALPKFIRTNYIELDLINRISRFRSGIGHSYTDDFESCRSMKHYFEPKGNVDWSVVKIFSPVSGEVIRVFEEWAGDQVQITPTDQPSFYLSIFHIKLIRPLKAGDRVTEGELLGTHIGAQTMSDIAVGVTVNGKRKLVSYFDVITDSLFQQYTRRGATSRAQFIITKEDRDGDSLRCAGDAFMNSGKLSHWVELQ